MDKLAGRIIDFNDDPRFVSDLRAQGLYGAELVDIARLDDLPDSAFAVKIASGGHTHRRFPIHNRVATQLSATYLSAASDAGLEPEITRVASYHVKDACERFGLDVPAIACGSVDPGTRDVTLVSSDQQGFRSIEKVAEYAHDRIASEFCNMGPERRTLAVQALVKAAGCDSIRSSMLWDYVPKAQYGPTFFTGMSMRGNLVKRAEADRIPIAGALFDQLEIELKTADPREAPKLLAQFDKLAGLDTRYREGLLDPYQTCWGGFALPKTARACVKASVDSILGPTHDRGSELEYLVDLEHRFPANDAGFSKVAAVACATVDSQSWPDTYKAAIRRYFA